MNFLATIVSSLAWPATIIFVGWYLKDHIVGFAKLLRQQLASGASLKYKEFEFRGIPIGGIDQLAGSRYQQQPAEDELLKVRNNTYNMQKNLFLVHRVKPTGIFHETNGQPTYDVLIYLIPHKGFGAINSVATVEYYFGRYFGLEQSNNGTKYIVSNGNDGFAVRVNAYGPMLCEARILFHDGSETLTSRYLDFEGVGYRFDPATLNEDQKKIDNAAQRTS